jgi:ribosomal protein S18 acetylase RimI-like enzyme/predicted nucleic acid-binding protein
MIADYLSCNYKACREEQRMGRVYRAEKDPAYLRRQLPAIRALADGEKEALGFLPEPAYSEAIERRRLIAMCSSAAGDIEVAGFILFSGVFPNARIQQVVVARQHRRAGVGSALINELVSHLEARAYLTLSAAVASDLSAAQSFYERNGFVACRTLPGGHARNRSIILRTRDLETENLFSVLEPPSGASQSAVDLGLRKRSAGQAPLYVIDLNVLFDVTKGKGRQRSPLAEQLIAAALDHQIRLAVAPEFVVELERTTKDEEIDPVLRLARQLPRLLSNDRAETERLSTLVHTIVFVTPSSSAAGSPQALSDARHLAQAALARASAYVTSDGQLLAAREQLLQQIGIDVASLDEFETLLPGDSVSADRSHLKGTDCVITSAPVEEVRYYLKRHGVMGSLLSEFAPNPENLGRWKGRSVSEAGEVVAIGACVAPANIDAPSRILVHVRPDHVACETLADHLLASQCQEACSSGPITIELPHVPGQSVVRRAATLLGFVPLPRADTSIKVALGRPVTNESWTAIARQTRRKTGLRLPEQPPDATAAQSGLVVQGPDGKSVTVRLPALEDALGPTILLWPDRDGVIVPIARNYADDLLGTGNQFPLFGSPEAAFVARRTYFNSPRTATLMRPGVPILFYESKRSGGRGAIVAAARIADATVVAKLHVPDDLLRRAVVEDLGPLSATNDLLATSFDNLLRFPTPVSLEKLRHLGVDVSQNLQTTMALPYARLAEILELGWSGA